MHGCLFSVSIVLMQKGGAIALQAWNKPSVIRQSRETIKKKQLLYNIMCYNFHKRLQMFKCHTGVKTQKHMKESREMQFLCGMASIKHPESDTRAQVEF